MAQWVTGIMALLAVAGQVANYILNLRLREAILESERRTLDRVAETYKRKDVCMAEMEALAR